MQKFNWSAVVGYLIIAIAIIIASQGIMNAIGNTPVGGSVPNSFDIYNHDSTTYGDFLYDYEAANYMKIEQETLMKWIQSGKLKGTYTQVDVWKNDENGQIVASGTEYIFSKVKLTEFMNNLINSGS